MSGTRIENHFALADNTGAQVSAGLSNMMANEERYRSVAKEAAAVFTGAAGEGNNAFNTSFSTKMEEFFTSLRNLNATIQRHAGSGGQVQIADNSAAAKFPQV